MRKYFLESFAGPDSGHVIEDRKEPFPWRSVLSEAALLLGFLLASSWLVSH
jgi:hypothetical protein